MFWTPRFHRDSLHRGHSIRDLLRRAPRAARVVVPVLLHFAGAAPAQEIVDGGPSAGRVLWLRADQDVKRGISNLVTEWDDQSGFANHFVNLNSSVALPEWRAAAVNGRPALHFDGNDYLYAFAGMPTGSYTKVVAFTLDSLAPTNNLFSGWTHHALYYGSSDHARLFHSGDFATSTASTPVGEPTVLVATYDATTGEGNLFENGVQVASGNDGGAGNPEATMLLGSFAFGNFMEGSLAEVMAYDHVVAGAELTRLHEYLLRRYRSDAAPVVTFKFLPRPAQVFQRDASDLAVVKVKGEVLTAGYDQVVVDVTRDGIAFDSQTKDLTYAGGKAAFTLQPVIGAGKDDYQFDVFLVAAGRRRLVASVPNVCAGDVWIVHGQSNAVAADYWGEHLANSESQGRWVRSFGTASLTAGDVPFDRHWDVANGESIYWHESIGQWGIRLGQLLQRKYDVPVAILNGAVGGTSITQHQRNDANPTDLNTIYGRLLYRASEAGITDSVRAMLWYQGESDSDHAMTWFSNWLTLRTDWAVDYPAMDSIYLFQIRDDCSGGAPKIREAQRQLQDRFSDTTVLSTTAAPAHDGCHFQHIGYRELGDRIARILGRDFYGSTDTQEIDPPNPASIAWNDAAHSQILVTFRDPDDRLIFDPGTEANFILDDGVAVTSGIISGNTLLLQLAGPSNATELSYWGHPFDGPWLKNARGVGGLTFFDLPIQ